MSLHHVKRPWTPKLIGGGRDLRGRRVWRSRRAMSAPRRRARRARAPATGAAPTQPESAPDLRTRPEARLTAGQSAAPSCRTHRRSRQRRNARDVDTLRAFQRGSAARARARAGGRAGVPTSRRFVRPKCPRSSKQRRAASSRSRAPATPVGSRPESCRGTAWLTDGQLVPTAPSRAEQQRASAANHLRWSVPQPEGIWFSLLKLVGGRVPGR
jgi:hypothetical protein